jgi:FdhD protein
MTAGMELTSSLDILEVSGAGIRCLTKAFPREMAADILVDGRFVSSLSASPSMMRELALGYLVCHGLISSVDQVEELEIDESTVSVSLGRQELARSVTGSELLIAPDTIQAVVDGINGNSRVYHATRAVHVAVLCMGDGGVVFSAEDIGRHNAVEKAIGLALEARTDLGQTILGLSGRIPCDMASMIWKAGIPVAVSVAFPTSDGILSARRAGLTLITARDGKIYIHSGDNRVRFDR